jgi:hypothetical protein
MTPVCLVFDHAATAFLGSEVRAAAYFISAHFFIVALDQQ